MIEPDGLLTISHLLLEGTDTGASAQVKLRRAVSTAYYALFHEIARQATNGLIGVRHRSSPRYTTVYRSFEHRHMLETCAAVDKATLGAKARTALGKTTASQAIRDVANAFQELQARRHWADYSPAGKIDRKEARELVELAELAITTLRAADDAERRDFLAYLMLPVRA